MTKGDCAKCAFWNPALSGIRKGVMGECRREAPRPDFKKDSGGRGVFPLTAQGDWCGRYEGTAPVIGL